MHRMTLLRLIGIAWLTFAAYVAPLTHAFAAPCDHHASVDGHAAGGHEHHARHDHAARAAPEQPNSDDTTARPDCCDGADACFGFSCSAGSLTALEPESVHTLVAGPIHAAVPLTPPHPPTAGHYLLPLRPPA